MHWITPKTLKPVAAACLLLAGLSAAAQTPSPAAVDPCSDFYGYVNAAWLASTELPPDRGRIGSFDLLQRANSQLIEAALRDIAPRPAAQPTPGLRLVAADFAAAMDEAAIEAAGLRALAPWLARIDALEKPEALPALLGALARLQVAAPLSAGVGPDAKDKRRYTLELDSAGLGLPDRDDYTRTDERAKALQQAYRRYVQLLLEGAGAAADAATVEGVMALEARLARATRARAEQRDPNANYNPFTPAALAEAAPGFDWAAYLRAYAGAASERVDRVVVDDPGFARALARQAGATPLPVWQAYLRVRLLDAFAPRLPKAFEQAEFDYRQKAIRGLQQPLPRAERVIQAMGRQAHREGLGELFVARAYSPEAQARALQMVADIRAAMLPRIDRLDWMTPATRQRARAKLEALQVKIGHPAQWRRYEGLTMAADDYAGNLLRGNEWQTEQGLADLGQPVDRSRWWMAPHIVNAYAGSLNDIVFPAGILQPPFFDPAADDATNYGAIGAVIGHEITHHFDDRGRQFDADGNLNDWWTEADAAAYRLRADRVAALFDGYQAAPGLNLSGRQTLGENISDLSGLQIAYDGLQIALARRGAPPVPGAATPSQRFFVAYATMWRAKYRAEALADQVRTGFHSPPPFRVLGALSNTPAFAHAFACAPGTPMAARDPITIW